MRVEREPLPAGGERGARHGVVEREPLPPTAGRGGERGTRSGADPACGTLSIVADSPAQADALAAALAGETGDDVPGSRARVARDGLRLTVRVEAEDAGALRAAVNAHLRWLRLAAEVHGVARD